MFVSKFDSKIFLSLVARLVICFIFLGDRLAESGALQLTLANLSMDHYPYHEHGNQRLIFIILIRSFFSFELGSSKQHWITYGDLPSSNRDQWSQRLKEQWSEELEQAKSRVIPDEMCTSATLRNNHASFILSYVSIKI